MSFNTRCAKLANRRLKGLGALVACSTLLLGSFIGAPELRAQTPSEAETIKFISDHVNKRAFFFFTTKYQGTFACNAGFTKASLEYIELHTTLCEVGPRLERWIIKINPHDIEKVEYVRAFKPYHGVRFFCKGGSPCIKDEIDDKLWESNSNRTLYYTGASDAERVARAFRHLLKLSSEKDQGLFSSNTPMSGKGRLGVTIQPVTDELAQGLNLNKARGVLVADVADDGPAQEAKIKIGDVILDYDGKQFAEQPELISMISNTPVGKKVTLGVWRGSKKIRLEAVTGESK